LDLREEDVDTSLDEADDLLIPKVDSDYFDDV
jgi:hypothetical protein